MKIAILSPIHPFRGGIASFSDSLYCELIKQNEVKVFSFSMLYPSWLFPGTSQYVDQQDSDINIPSQMTLNSLNPISYIATAQKINKFAPDILLVAYWMPFLAPALGTVCRFVNKNIKTVGLIHNALPHETKSTDKILTKYFFRRCDAFITLSDAVKFDVDKLIPNANVLLSPHPIYEHYKNRIDREVACQRLNIASYKKNLLFFGLIREYKGLDLLIEAMSYLDNTYQLVIVGESYEDFKKYQDLIDSSSLKENIKVFAQYVPDDMVSVYFSTSDVLVLPYRSATQSGVVGVAYQLDTPIVATNVGAMGEMIRQYNTGIVVDDISAKGIAEGIISFFAGNNAAKYIANIQAEKKRLSWQTFTTNIREFLVEK